MDWGRKFQSGLGLIVMWTIMLISGHLTEASYILLVPATVTALFVTSVAGKFANRSN